VPWPVELFDALPSRRAAATVLDALVPVDWPDAELQKLLDLYEPRLRSDPSLLGFGPWVVIGEREVVGSAGFLGPPNESGEIELGYGIREEHRNLGYATEAARALLSWALAQPRVERVVARSDPDNRASNRVLEKSGLLRAGSGRWVSPARGDGA
jgi:[ribosomal protein S5]-alanine N-acetyltransferase